jgi:hypothetical protein
MDLGKGGQRQLLNSDSDGVLYKMRMNAGSYLSLIELGSRDESQFSHRAYICGHCSNDLLQIFWKLTHNRKSIYLNKYTRKYFKVLV